MGWLERLETKQEDNFTPEHAVFSTSSLPRSSYRYGRDVRHGLDSNVITSPLSWVMRNFTEAEAVVQRRTQGRWERVDAHELARTMARPNPFYGGGLLWRSTVLSYVLDGNAYWQKVRNVFGEVIGYWYLPHFLVEPRFPFDGSEFISYYDYRPIGGGPAVRLPVRDVVHLRQDALDPDNPRKGLSKLRTLLREVFTDEEAANFSASILRNMGVPGGIIAPKDKDALPNREDAREMKEFMRNAFTGDKRGEWLVLGTPTEIAQFGFDPNRLMLTNLRDIPEERVCAAIGIPAAVVGFGAGLQQTKVGATMKELRKEAWDSCIRPMQNAIAEQVTFQAMGDFQSESSVHRYRVKFDASNFAASQEEEKERADRLAVYVNAGILRVDKAQELAGLEVDPSQAVYLRPANAVAVPVGDPGVQQPISEPQPGSDDDDAGVGEPSLNGDGLMDPNRIREIIAQLEGD